MKTSDIISGLQTLAPYYDKPDGYHCGAEHDVLYAYLTDRRLSDDDINKMIAMGWHQDHDERDYDEDFSKDDYRQDEPWSAYT